MMKIGGQRKGRMIAVAFATIIAMSLLFCAIGFASSGSSQKVTVKDIAAKDEKIPIIIVLKDQYKLKPHLFSRERIQSMKSFAEERQRALMTMLKSEAEKGRVEDIKQLWIVNAIACKATPQVIEELKKRPDVARIELDRKVHLLDSGKVRKEKRFFKTFNATQTIKWIHPSEEEGKKEVAWGVKWIEAPEVWANGINGSGVKVAVIDTGINVSHPDLQGKVVAWKDFVNNQPTPYDDNGHGTHVAGTIAGTGKAGIKTGVAPGASLLVAKVFNELGYATESDVINAFQWAAENGADVISYSGGLLPIDEVWGEETVNASETKTHIIQVYDNLDESFKPAFIAAYVYSPDLQNLSVSLIAPNGTVVQGDYMEWLPWLVLPEDRDYLWIYKYSENNPLPSGNWSLNVTSLKTTTNHVWYSGAGDNLNNILSRNFDLSGVSNATLKFWTKYDIEEGWDYGFVEISTDGIYWATLATYTGTSAPHIESIDLSDYAGTNVIIRFRYTTDPGIAYPGWYIDNITIPEIGFYDDVEAGANNWSSYGWTIVKGPISYEYGLLVAYPDDGTSAQAQAINNIADMGVVPVIAAGNDGMFGLRTINSPGSASKAITVGATDYMMDYIAWFSSRGPVGYGAYEKVKPDVVAPGVNITSTWYEGGYMEMGGTSMATPHVSGVVALMLQANSSLTPEKVKQILKKSSFDLGREGEDNTYGAGRVDAYAAVSNVTPAFNIAPSAKPKLYAGFARWSYMVNQPVTLTAISWNGTAVNGTEVRFIIEHYNLTSDSYEVVVNTTNVTDAMGLATATFTPIDAGEYDATIVDEYGNFVHDWIWVSPPPPEKPFDTPPQDYIAMPNETVKMKYTLVTPDFKPYNGDVNLVIRDWWNWEVVVNVSLTPVNGTIAYDLNLSEYSFDDSGWWGDIHIENGADSIHAGWLEINPGGYTSELYPWNVKASPGDTVTFLFLRYNYINNSPAPDKEYTVNVYWLKEVEVKSLAKTNFEFMNELMSSEKMVKGEKVRLLSEIKNLGVNYTSFNISTTNGIATFNVSVPEDVYIGMVEVEGEYSESYIIVDKTPWLHHRAVPEEEKAKLIIWTDWDGYWDEVNRKVKPYDNFTVYVSLYNGTEPISNAKVYLYTEDEAKTVVTDERGRANTTFPISYNESLPSWYNAMQVVGLYNNTWDYTYARPPHIWSEINANIKNNQLNIDVQHKFKGELVKAPSILTVDKGWWWESRGTLVSKYIDESEHHESLSVGFGDYEIRDILNVHRWWFTYVSNSPLEILTPIYNIYLANSTVPIQVHMKNNESGVTVYLYEEGYGYGYWSYIDTTTTDANGNATLNLKVPSNGYVHYMIGGSNSSFVFVADRGYFIVTKEAKPDLVPEIDIPKQILTGEHVFNVTVYNIGTVESSETTMNIYVDDSLINTTNMPAIGVGAYKKFTYNYNFTEGSHTIKVVVDPQNLNDELNEMNNISVKSIMAVTPTPTPPLIWNATISATNQLEPVVVGMHPNATDGYDPGFDNYTQTPQQGKVIMSLDEIYAVNIKKSVPPGFNVTWNLSVGVPSGKTTTLIWNKHPHPQVVLHIFNGSEEIEPGTVLGGGNHSLLVVAEVVESVSFTLHLKAGWNMVSIPLILENSSVYEVFKDIPTLDIRPVVTWQSPIFVPVSNIEPKKGYWVFTPQDIDIVVSGMPVLDTNLSLKAGWNMIGTTGLNKLNLTQIPNQVPQRPPVTWQSPIFVPVTELEPGRAAWVFVTQDTEVKI